MKTFHKFSLFCLFSALFALLGANSVFAEDNLSISVSISPAIHRITLDPGAVYHNSVTVSNPDNRTIKVHMNVEPYSVEDITYAPIYTVQNAYTQISSWITFDDDEDFIIKPYESKIVYYTVTVPTDVPSGGQYAAIFAESEALTSEESVEARANIGSVMIARVNGETRETGEILSTKISGFLLNPPVHVSASFKNTGNVDADAVLRVKVENYFTGDVIYDGTNEPLEKTILPGTTRTLDQDLENVPRLGILKVTLTTEFMDDAEVKTRIVLICPIWFIAIILLIILVIVGRIVAKKREDHRTRENSKNERGSSKEFNI